VRLGAVELSKCDPIQDTNCKDYIIKSFTSYPFYEPESLRNDIALIKLSKVVEFTEFIHPACLNQNTSIYSKVVAVSDRLRLETKMKNSLTDWLGKN